MDRPITLWEFLQDVEEIITFNMDEIGSNVHPTVIIVSASLSLVGALGGAKHVKLDIER